MIETKIMQIVPATGWYAHLYNNNKDIDLTWPVICWGLTDTGKTYGLVVYRGEIIPAPEVSVDSNSEIGFFGYVDQATVERWAKEK